MTTWYGGNGWGWCGMIAHVPSMVILWGVVFSATALAVALPSGSERIRRPRRPPVLSSPKARSRLALAAAKRTTTNSRAD